MVNTYTNTYFTPDLSNWTAPPGTEYHHPTDDPVTLILTCSCGKERKVTHQVYEQWTCECGVRITFNELGFSFQQKRSRKRMKTLEQIEAFITELSALAEKSRIRIKGSHLGQGIYGKITLFDLDDPEPRRTYSVDLNEKVAGSTDY